jgi:hypothetical protein
MCADVALSISQLQAYTIKAFAVGTVERNPILPNVPRFEAARDGERRHYGGDLRIKRDLMATSIQEILGEIRESCLQDDRVRNGGYDAIIPQAQPYEAPEDCGAGTLRHDIANATFAQRSGPAKRLGQQLGVGRFR